MAVDTGSRFVGRETELASLREALLGALGGEGQLALLVGEPGIGKTHTARTLAALAAERGAVVAWGRCPEAEGAPSYWPFVQALEACADTSERREAVALLRAGDSADAGDASPERARFALCDRVTRALAASARARPLVIAIDDLHWADEGSLVLLEFLARQLAGVPLLVLATLRDEARGPSHAASSCGRCRPPGRSTATATDSVTTRSSGSARTRSIPTRTTTACWTAPKC